MPLGAGASDSESSGGARWNVVTPNPAAKGTGSTAVPRTTAPRARRISRIRNRATNTANLPGRNGTHLAGRTHGARRVSGDHRTHRNGQARHGRAAALSPARDTRASPARDTRASPARARASPARLAAPAAQPGTESRSGTCGRIRTGRIPAGPILPPPRRSGSGRGPSGRSRDPDPGTIPAATKARTPADGRAIPRAWGRADIRAGRRHRSECRGQRLPVRQGRPTTPGAAPRVPPPGRARRDLTPWPARAASQARTRPGRPRRPPTRPARRHPGRTHRGPAYPAPLRPPAPAPRARTGRRALTGGRAGTGGARPAGRKTATGGDSRAATSPGRKRATGPGPAGNTGSTPARPTDLDRRTDTGPDPGEAYGRGPQEGYAPGPGEAYGPRPADAAYAPGPGGGLRAQASGRLRARTPADGLRAQASGRLRARARRTATGPGQRTATGLSPADGYGP